VPKRLFWIPATLRARLVAAAAGSIVAAVAVFGTITVLLVVAVFLASAVEMVEAATGVNLWHEWVRIELAHVSGEKYRLPEVHEGYAGVLQCLAHQEHPDLMAYNDPEVTWRNAKAYHAGLIVASLDPARIETLLDDYRERFARDFLAVLPPLDRPPA